MSGNSKSHTASRIAASLSVLLITHMPGRNYFQVVNSTEFWTSGSHGSFLNNPLPQMQQAAYHWAVNRFGRNRPKYIPRSR